MIDIFKEGPRAPRPAGDILSRLVRITIGGTEYELPVRSIKANREWKAALNEKTQGLLNGLDASKDDLGAIFSVLANQIDDLIDLLVSYDTAGILPSRDEIEEIEPDPSRDIVTAVGEVWRAANPLVVTAMTGILAATTETAASSPPTSSPPASITGRRTRSRTG